MGEYKEILKLLNIRLEQKHKQYGVTYLDRTYKWLRRRLRGELVELDDELHPGYISMSDIQTEAIDVAICALLIADKARREIEECTHEWHADQDNDCNFCVKCGARQEIYTE